MAFYPTNLGGSGGTGDTLVSGGLVYGGAAYVFIPKEIIDQYNYITLDSNTNGNVYYDDNRMSFTNIGKGVKTAISSLNTFTKSLGTACGSTTIGTITLTKT